MDSVLVASQSIMGRMHERGIKNLFHVPLGVDCETFHPGRKDNGLIEELKAGDPRRLTIFFGHRFCEEKGLRTFLTSYPLICRRLGHEPAVVFAGTGPDLSMVKQAVEDYRHIRYVGFIRDPLEMAKWYASCELGLMMSGWETFGLSVLEAMASGQLVIGADQGGTKEHAEASGAGWTFQVGQWQSLVETVAKFYWEDGKEVRRRKGREYAQRHTWDACFQREMEIYRELADRCPA
jgi:alpha-1,6-mannosyltransferase